MNQKERDTLDRTLKELKECQESLTQLKALRKITYAKIKQELLDLQRNVPFHDLDEALDKQEE